MGNEVDDAARLNVLALPRATTVRFLILVMAMLATGLVVGTLLHNSIFRVEYMGQFIRCQSDPVPLLCMRSAERRRTLLAFAVAAAVVAGAVVVALVAPTVIEGRRRLRPVAPAFPRAAARLVELSREAGLRRPPQLVRGPLLTSVTDGFSYGRPGHHRIGVPTWLLLRPTSSAFDAVIRHELAHLTHRDVGLAWMTWGAWFALLPALLAPYLAAAIDGDPSVLLAYTWRIAVLATGVLVVQNALLRSREHDADLRAAWLGGGPDSVIAFLAARPGPTGLRRVASFHPSAVDRARVLRQPRLAVRVGFLDGLTATLFIATALPVVVGHVSSALLGGQWVWSGLSLAAGVLGALLGAALGLGLWCQSLVERHTGGRARVWPVALGVLIGGVIGDAVSLGGGGLVGLGAASRPGLILVVPIALVGATFATAGLGELWSASATRTCSPRRFWIPAALAGAAMFAAAMWSATWLSTALRFGGWPLASQAMISTPAVSPVATLAVVLGGATAWAMWRAARFGTTPPAWLFPFSDSYRPRHRVLGLGATVAIGLLAGLSGAAVLLWLRVVTGPASGFELPQRLLVNAAIAAVAGLAAGVALTITYGTPGRGAALFAGPVATLPVAAAAVVATVADPPPWSALPSLVVTCLALQLLLWIATGWIPPAVSIAVRGRTSLLLTAGLAAGLAVGATSVVSAAREVVAPTGPAASYSDP
ncbi:MAG: M48 family metalloprotease, partial [Pseudonocardia sp.]|nr:M48 family metalloprotease [Pseudonocardia sp.]